MSSQSRSHRAANQCRPHARHLFTLGAAITSYTSVGGPGGSTTPAACQRPPRSCQGCIPVPTSEFGCLLPLPWVSSGLSVAVAVPGTELPAFLPFQETACAYVLIVTAVYWVSEAVPLGAAALVPAFLYPFFGVLRSSEVRPPAAQPPARTPARPVTEGSREREMHKAVEEKALF